MELETEEVLRLPYLFNGYCAGSWNSDSVITGGFHAISVQNHDGRTFFLKLGVVLFLSKSVCTGQLNTE